VRRWVMVLDLVWPVLLVAGLVAVVRCAAAGSAVSGLVAVVLLGMGWKGLRYSQRMRRML